MKLGMMQPYFFPYLGYFSLIHQSDEWVVFDTAQFMRHGWISRNRILHPDEGWQYIMVPVAKHPMRVAINEVSISDHLDWRARIRGQLQHYKKTAPWFNEAMGLVESCLQFEATGLAEFNVHCLRLCCDFIGLEFNPRLFSSLDVDRDNITHAGAWALETSRVLGAHEYLNPAGGKELFREEEFQAAGIKLSFVEPLDFGYDCRGYSFEPSLGIIDVLMWNSTDQVMAVLENAKANTE